MHSLPSIGIGIIGAILEEEERDLAKEDITEAVEMEHLMSIQLNFEKTEKTRKVR